MDNIVISNPTEFERKKQQIKSGGVSKLHVLADFDKTLSKGFWNGEKRSSLVEIIRKHNYLTPAYAPRAYELFDIYHPFETDSHLSFDQKKAKMVEWWTMHVKWMGVSGMSRAMVEKIVSEQEFGPREGLRTFLDTLHSKSIPLLILSGSVTDLIEGFLKKEGMLFPNMHVISNKYKFDETGRVIGYESHIVHSLNKDETIIKGTPYEKMIENRRNVLLLGDSLDDVLMVNGFDHDVVLKIGFLNHDVEKKLPAFSEAFDVVITNDGPMDFVNAMITHLFE